MKQNYDSIEDGLRGGLDEWEWKMGVEIQGLRLNFS
jgi:hypothetical protein